MDDFGWYEVVCLAMIVGAFVHGTYSGRRVWLEKGITGCLKSLEEQGLIKVTELADGETEISRPDNSGM